MAFDWQVENEGASRRVVVTKDLPGRRWREILQAAHCEIVYSTSDAILPAAEILRAIGDRCDGVIGQLTEKWGDELFAALEAAGGRAYSNYAVGYDNVDLDAATRHGIAVGNTPGVLTETTAEMAAALTFAAARRVTEADAFLRQGKFHGWLPHLFLGKRLFGGTLGIVGCGRIGSAYARIVAPGCAMRVQYFDTVPNEALEVFFEQFAVIANAEGRPVPTCRRVDSLDDLLTSSDVVSLHVSLSETTRHLINAERLQLMRPDAILVNTSRGPVVDEAALVAHLRDHPQFRVGLDVFENEPALAPGLAELPNAVIVPHIASATVWTRSGMASLAAANVAGVLNRYPVAQELAVEDYLEGEIPQEAPSILNAADLGL